MGERELMEKLIEELLFKVNTLHEMINSAEWRQYSRKSFIHALNNSIEKLVEVEDTLKEMHERIEEEPSIEAPEIEPLIKEFDKTIRVLRNNIAFEEELFEKQEEILDVKDKVEVPELYANLSEKILALLLRTRFLIERVHLFTSAEKITPLEGKSTAKNIMQLLRTKEKEYQELKEKFENLKSQSFGAKLEKTTSSDLENEVNEVSRKLETQHTMLSKEFTEFREEIEALNQKYNSIREKINSCDDLSYSFMEKAGGLTTTLKKERDYAKRMVMEIEHETLRLRGAYSRELLNLQESKLKAKEEAKKEVQQKIKHLEEELKEKNSLLEEFKKILHEKHLKVGELEKEVELKRAKKIVKETTGEEIKVSGIKKKKKRKK
ncbi:hypothetical protein KJ660_01690 [Candidatus Micrarchaeota archaeon]|nr:hypothetical protein [Candidatus Micrarchaeota archaeon]